MRALRQTRNLLVGAMISLASAAAAFYFASTTANEARKDLMGATLGEIIVPTLRGGYWRTPRT